MRNTLRIVQRGDLNSVSITNVSIPKKAPVTFFPFQPQVAVSNLCRESLSLLLAEYRFILNIGSNGEWSHNKVFCVSLHYMQKPS